MEKNTSDLEVAIYRPIKFGKQSL